VILSSEGDAIVAEMGKSRGMAMITEITHMQLSIGVHDSVKVGTE
jgi:hypothetical protein